MKFNLKGFVVANGVSDWGIDTYPSMIDNWHRFNIIPTKQLQKFKENKCTFTFHNVLPFKGKDKHLCYKLLSKIYKNARKLNIYDILRKNYNIKSNKSAIKEPKYGQAVINGQQVSYKRSFSITEYAPWTKQIFALDKESGEDQDFLAGWYYSTDYLNRQDVRDTLHIKTS